MTEPSTPAETDAPEPSDSGTDQPLPEVDDSALERARESIEEAKDAESSVAASDDITTDDEQRAGEYSEAADGAGGT